MAMPTFTFNQAGGSNPASASGAGPATALTGAAASFSGSVVTLDGSPDLSGVDATGLHVLYLATTTGRRWFRITAVDNGADTVTVHSAPAGTASGLSWAIGGKLKDLDNTNTRLIFSDDAESGWRFSLEDDQTISTGLDVTPTGHTSGTAEPLVFQSSSAETLRTITQTSNSYNFQSNVTTGPICVTDLKLANSNATKTNAIGFSARGKLIARRCVFGDATNKLLKGVTRNGGTPYFFLTECRITSCTDDAIESSSTEVCRLVNCRIDNNTGNGMDVAINDSLSIVGCEFHDNGGSGIEINNSGGASVAIIGSTIHSNTADGISFITSALHAQTLILGNNITGNGGYGIDDNSLANYGIIVRANNFGTGATANTSGQSRGLSLEASNVGVDPQYANAAGGDFTPGANVRGKGYPPNTEVTAGGHGVATNYSHIGSIQPDESSGGGVNGISIIGGGV